MSIPTIGEEFAKLTEYLRRSQESCATISHLTGLQGSVNDQALAKGWLMVSEQLKRMQRVCIELGKGKLQ